MSRSNHAYAVILTGTHKTDLTAIAILMARARGRTFGVLAPTVDQARRLSAHYAVPARSVRQRPDSTWLTYVFVDAQCMPLHRFIRVAGYSRGRGARLIISGHPPTTRSGAWLAKLWKSLRYPVLDFGAAAAKEGNERR